MPKQGSSFTFAAGNASKILAAPAYALGAIASALVKRQPNLWIFGSGSGLGEGSLALLEHVRAADPARTLVWLGRSDRELREAHERGITAVQKSSFQGFRTTLRAGLIAVTHGFGDVNRFATRGAFVVQLWHGIPLKHIQLDSPVTFASRVPAFRALLRGMYRRSSQAIDLLPAASPVSATRLRSAFGLDNARVVVTGDPRDDVLARRTREQCRATLAGLIGALPATLILYAPTWRDGEEDPAIPSDAEWTAIGEWLQAADAMLVVRPHPHGLGDYEEGVRRSSRVRLLDSRRLPDVTPVLPAFDRLVTDYSSIAFDFALTGAPIAFLAPDVSSYAASRGLYEPYVAFSGGTEVATWSELLALLGDEATLAELRAHSTALADTHHAYRDGGNTGRVYAEILARLEGSK